ncbi:MFS transporter [Limosilactobacillus sp. RRLNB_1_1]|uniref:MFS transporter n=1 Tax=Limosilactobacillus albertensis TaxID=2759752 RepID=A0A7W3Y7T0_9LACO|nr:MFS transporter [Limosilactobacillus albertensis]MBB1068936.1 MFS transporter [Limosilactobacillus albertensis]MCD7118696.1 MFS transporter [Limosilactobacillus albertensis]MCD7128155.1 MFS transporter [Limosilactobacillus albertensis]
MKYRLQSIVFVTVAFILGCNEFMVVGVLSQIARSYHVSLSTIGLLVTLFALTYAICTPIITTITSKYNRFKVLMTMMVIFWCGNTLTAFAPNIFWLFVSRIVTAAVAGVIISLIMVYVSIVAPLEKRSILVAIVFAGFSVATIVGVPIGTTISMLWSWHISFLLISVLTLIIGISLYWLVPRTDSHTSNSVKAQLRLLGDRRIILAIVVMSSLLAAQYTFYTYIRPIIMNILGFSAAQLNFLLGLIGIMFIIGNLCAGALSNRYGITKLPIISVACLILILLMGIGFQISWVGMGLIGLACLFLGMPGSILQVMFLGVAEKDYPEALSFASSLNPICTNVGTSLGSFVGAISLHWIPLSQISYVAAIFAAIGLISAIRLTKVSCN